ncbi:TetR/AcrR family transcriptional regulator [Luedemannella helvata]|uniref:TetR/AcrR family transcriptional regulator n=1 Tax=Luedemannella helvata TaxID=349315 RepID=A0ABN2L4K0_9ACTN
MNPSRTDRSGYHHGDLANALTKAATELARTGGPEAVVLREAARQVGVSATAAYRHFAGHSELIHAVKEYALSRLGAAMQVELAATDPLPDPAEDAYRRLAALGRGYLNFAVAEPGLFRTAFCHADKPTFDSLDKDPNATEPYRLLSAVLDDLVAVGSLDLDRREYAETMAWSTVHGLALLMLEGPLQNLPQEVYDAVVNRLTAFVRDGLTTR